MKIAYSNYSVAFDQNKKLPLNNTQHEQNKSISNNYDHTSYNSKAIQQDFNAITYSTANVYSNYKNKTAPNNESQSNDQLTKEVTNNKEEQLKQPEEKAEIKELQIIEQKVRTHEQAHKAAGAGVTGAISYTYTTGPDGKRYISGGEVSVGTSGGSSPEESLKQLEQVKRAALAPADPSPQDLSVAASTSAQIMQVRGEIAREKSEELNNNTSEQVGKAASDGKSNSNSQVTNTDRSDNHSTIRQSESNENSQEQRNKEDFEKLAIERAYNQATSTYKLQMNIAQKGLMQQPMFSQIA